MSNMLQYLNQASVSCAILTFICVVAYQRSKNIKLKLEDVLVRVFAGSAIPTSLALLMCAFKPSLLQKMTGFNIHIATAGLALLFISVKALSEKSKIAQERQEPKQGA